MLSLLKHKIIRLVFHFTKISLDSFLFVLLTKKTRKLIRHSFKTGSFAIACLSAQCSPFYLPIVIGRAHV